MKHKEVELLALFDRIPARAVIVFFEGSSEMSAGTLPKNEAIIYLLQRITDRTDFEVNTEFDGRIMIGFATKNPDYTILWYTPDI